MPIKALDHATVLTRDTAVTVAFYRDLFGLEPGPRPNFDFGGAWLYAGEACVLHIVERADIPEAAGPIDHVAFRGEGRKDCIAEIERRGLPHRIVPLPGGGPAKGQMWQLFINDPNGAMVEVLFREAA